MPVTTPDNTIAAVTSTPAATAVTAPDAKDHKATTTASPVTPHSKQKPAPLRGDEKTIQLLTYLETRAPIIGDCITNAFRDLKEAKHDANVGPLIKKLCRELLAEKLRSVDAYNNLVTSEASGKRIPEEVFKSASDYMSHIDIEYNKIIAENYWVAYFLLEIELEVAGNFPLVSAASVAQLCHCLPKDVYTAMPGFYTFLQKCDTDIACRKAFLNAAPDSNLGPAMKKLSNNKRGFINSAINALQPINPDMKDTVLVPFDPGMKDTVLVPLRLSNRM